MAITAQTCDTDGIHIWTDNNAFAEFDAGGINSLVAQVGKDAAQTSIAETLARIAEVDATKVTVTLGGPIPNVEWTW